MAGLLTDVYLCRFKRVFLVILAARFAVSKIHLDAKPRRNVAVSRSQTVVIHACEKN
jgi:hypothetical protein